MQFLFSRISKTNMRNQGKKLFSAFRCISDYLRVVDKDFINKFVHKEMDLCVNNYIMNVN